MDEITVTNNADVNGVYRAVDRAPVRNWIAGRLRVIAEWFDCSGRVAFYSLRLANRIAVSPIRWDRITLSGESPTATIVWQDEKWQIIADDGETYHSD